MNFEEAYDKYINCIIDYYSLLRGLACLQRVRTMRNVDSITTAAARNVVERIQPNSSHFTAIFEVEVTSGWVLTIVEVLLVSVKTGELSTA